MDQWKRVSARMYEHEWREVMLLLGGVLHSRGRERLDWLFGRMLESVPEGADLAAQARCFGLLGAMPRDLDAVKYELPPPAAERFARMRDAVMGIFTAAGGAKVKFKARVEAAEALGASDPRLKMPGDEGYWVEIPGGTFWMGAQRKDPNGRNYDTEALDNEPVRQARVAAFRLGRYPVTVWEYGRYLEETGSEAPSNWDDFISARSSRCAIIPGGANSSSNCASAWTSTGAGTRMPPVIRSSSRNRWGPWK